MMDDDTVADSAANAAGIARRPESKSLEAPKIYKTVGTFDPSERFIIDDTAVQNPTAQQPTLMAGGDCNHHPPFDVEMRQVRSTPGQPPTLLPLRPRRRLTLRAP